MRNRILVTLVVTTSFLSAMALPTDAAAQVMLSPRGVNPDAYLPPSSSMPEYIDCGVGDITACYLVQFGDCADDRPRVAIPACTRALAQQDNRRRQTDIRFERAVRYALRANAHAALGNTDNALADYDRAVRADQSIFWIHSERGDAYFSAGDYAEALVSYNVALAMKPDVASALSNRALILAAAPDDELLNAEQALEDAQSARQIDRGQPAYADSLAIALAANGEFERAATEATRAIDLLPTGNDDTLQRYQERLALFQAGNSYRIPGE